VPVVYNKSFAAVDPTNSGETSVSALTRVLQTSSLPAATVDKVQGLIIRYSSAAN
jgi:sorting nexin-8